MNIRLYTGTDYQNYSSFSPVTEKTRPQAEKAAGNFDTVTLQKTAPADEEGFARILARQAASKLGQGASTEKVMGLKQQVASGAYHPDSASIARHILGYS